MSRLAKSRRTMTCRLAILAGAVMSGFRMVVLVVVVVAFGAVV